MLILASNSPRRRELLLSLGIPFAVEAADIEEIESLDDPREVPLRNAERKAAERYLSLVSVLDKAGAYAIQESGEFLVESVDGSIENVIGLPLERLQEELMRLND